MLGHADPSLWIAGEPRWASRTCARCCYIKAHRGRHVCIRVLFIAVLYHGSSTRGAEGRPHRRLHLLHLLQGQEEDARRRPVVGRRDQDQRLRATRSRSLPAERGARSPPTQPSGTDRASKSEDKSNLDYKVLGTIEKAGAVHCYRYACARLASREHDARPGIVRDAARARRLRRLAPPPQVGGHVAPPAARRPR